MDFAALQQKLFDLDPTDRAEDLRRLTESVGNTQESVQTEENFLQESVEVQQGTMPVEGDYSLNDFAALAGVTLNESQKTGSAGQLKGKDPMPKAKPRGKHPHVDKLVGEDLADISRAAQASAKQSITAPDGAERFLKKKFGIGAKAKDDKASKSDTDSAPVAKAGDWKGFLKQHTAQLQKISADPKKKKQFDAMMAKIGEGIQESPQSQSNTELKRPKAASTSQGEVKAQRKSTRAKERVKGKKDAAEVESIKEMLYRKLNAK